MQFEPRDRAVTGSIGHRQGRAADPFDQALPPCSQGHPWFAAGAKMAWGGVHRCRARKRFREHRQSIEVAERHRKGEDRGLMERPAALRPSEPRK